MGDWDYINENFGGHGDDGLPNFLNKSESNDNRYSKNNNHTDSNYKKKCNLKIDTSLKNTIRLYIDLTPKIFLDHNQLIAREKLEKQYQIDLTIKHNKYNSHDILALEVYYDNLLIGYVRKQYKYENINYASDINSFCFNNGILNKLNIEYYNGDYIISKNNDNTQEVEDENTSSEPGIIIKTIVFVVMIGLSISIAPVVAGFAVIYLFYYFLSKK